MQAGDFYGSEQSVVIDKAGSVKIEFVGADGTTQVLKEKTAVEAGEVIDAAVMSRQALRAFYAEAIEDGQAAGRAALATRQGDDDEGLRPDHLWPCGDGLLSRCF